MCSNTQCHSCSAVYAEPYTFSTVRLIYGHNMCNECDGVQPGSQKIIMHKYSIRSSTCAETNTEVNQYGNMLKKKLTHTTGAPTICNRTVLVLYLSMSSAYGNTHVSLFLYIYIYP